MLEGHPNIWSHADHDADVREIERFLSALSQSKDAEQFNKHFARDIAWGSPTGYVIAGLDALHAIHQRFFVGPSNGFSSRFLLENIAFLDSSLAVAHVRRITLDPTGRAVPPEARLGSPVLHEVAMYVFVKRENAWWLAAGQNTPVYRPPSDFRDAP